MAISSAQEDTNGQSRELARRAAQDLYEAELALHDARQSGVDAWTGAAADHLHIAAVRYQNAIRSVEADASPRTAA